MTQNEDKELLMRDLSGRLPYGVKASTKVGGNIKISFIKEDTIIGEDGDSYDISFITPYLFPLSSMIEEQMEELEKLCDMYTPDDDYTFNLKINVIDWINKNHFDYRGLIKKRLAIDATDKNIY